MTCSCQFGKLQVDRMEYTLRLPDFLRIFRIPYTDIRFLTPFKSRTTVSPNTSE